MMQVVNLVIHRVIKDQIRSGAQETEQVANSTKVLSRQFLPAETFFLSNRAQSVALTQPLQLNRCLHSSDWNKHDGGYANTSFTLFSQISVY